MAEGDITPKDLREDVKELTDKIINLTEKTAKRVGVLDRAITSFENQKPEPYWKKALITAGVSMISIVITILLIMLLARATDFCKVNFTAGESGGLERCEQK